jgi:hypothetical protein
MVAISRKQSAITGNVASALIRPDQPEISLASSKEVATEARAPVCSASMAHQSNLVVWL